jgi:ubiquinone/menaquinone biosynthesis C-methylase UbiE
MTADGGLRARLRRVQASALSAAAHAALWVLRHLPLGEHAERFLLERTWGSGSAEMLDAYLVSGYQNPRINVQSILVRHALAARIFGAESRELMADEIGFAIELNEVLRQRAQELGVRMGSYRNPVKHAAVRRVDAAVASRERTFQDRWRAWMDGRIGERVSVLEFACGSANDYRAFAEAGLGAHLDYLGIDLSPKNVANARRRHPEARFEVGDILELPQPDRSFDLVVASDIFEHLSLEAMEAALAEAARLAREGLILTFFNMADAPDHDVRRRRAYHWNTLSRPRIEARLRDLGFGSLLVVPVARWLKTVHGYAHSYNRHAWTIFAERTPRIVATLPHWSDDGADRA